MCEDKNKKHFSIGNGILINGDCLQEMKNLEPASIDMILTDLPYGTTQCKWDEIIPLTELWKEYNRVIKKNGAIVLTASQPFTSVLIMSNIKNFKYEWIWEKSKASGFLNAKRRPLVSHESVLVFCNGKVPYYPQMTKGIPYNKGVRKPQEDDDLYGKYDEREVKSSGSRYPRSVFKFTTAEREGSYHKTQKPIKLFEYLIKTYTLENNAVLDSCSGSATTAIACENLNRKWVCIEKDLSIYEKSKMRVEKLYALK